MCIPNKENNLQLEDIIARVATMGSSELDTLQEAIDRRRGTPKKRQSTVLERRDYRNGILQLEGRAYRRKKDGELTQRGPY
jgi:hypothetical protein